MLLLQYFVNTLQTVAQDGKMKKIEQKESGGFFHAHDQK
jgi:hypothetical protein